jgi:hypothetical protein
MRTSTQAGLWILLLTVSVGPTRALAFSDPERFTAPTHEGGGGGRFFTGSWADGFTCAVCHRGGSAPAINIAGLPRAGFSPGQIVEAELTFGSGPGNHSLALEVVDGGGRDLGLELLPDDQISISERCGATQEAKRASYISQLGARRILGMEACEARAVRFRFRTPQTDRAMLVATVLASDNSATIEGDGVTEVTQLLYQNPSAARAAEDSGCSPNSGPADLRTSFALLLLAALWRYRSRYQRAR